MRQYIKNIMLTAALLLSAVVARGQDDGGNVAVDGGAVTENDAAVSFVIMLNGVENAAGGTARASVNDGVCTLTLTPAEGNYITLENLTAVKTIESGMAQAPRRAPAVDNTPIEITATDTYADPSGTTTYTFQMPSEEYGVEVTANFQERQSIQKAKITLSDNFFFYDGNAKEPLVNSVMLGDVSLVFTDYTVNYEDNTEIGEATVKVAGLRTYKDTATVHFTIGDQLPVSIVVSPTTGVYDNKVVSISVPDAWDDDQLIYSYYNYDTKESSGDTEYTAPFTLNKAGKYIVKARVRRGEINGTESNAVVYVVKQPRFSPEGGKYDRERQVKIVDLPTLPTGVDEYPQVWVQKIMEGAEKADERRYFNGDTINVSTTTTIKAYVIDKSAPGDAGGEGAVLGGEEFSATYTYETVEDYHLTVAGVQVTTLNKDNVMGDNTKSVRYDAETGILTLNNANIGTGTIANGIETSLSTLTVHLIGVNTLTSSTYGFYSATNGSVTFTTPDGNPGKLHFVGPQDGDDIVGLTASYVNLQLADHWITIPPQPYGLVVNTTQVNSANYDDVLGDGHVRYDAQTKTLVLDNAQLTDVVSSLDALRIHLLKSSTIENNAAAPLRSSQSGAQLCFTTSPNTPGTLVLTNSSDIFISGFATPETEYDLVMQTLDNHSAMVSTFVPIAPIAEDDGSGNAPTGGEDFDSSSFFDDGGDAVDLSNTEINNVLYTLSESEGIFDEGDDSFDNPSGIVLTVQMSEEKVDEAQGQTPGTQEYADVFKGITLMVPAGIGEVIVVAQTGSGAVLNVRIGDAEPYQISNVSFSDTTRIPFNVAEPTYVYVYLANGNGTQMAQAVGPRRDRVPTGHVKVSNIGSSSSVMVNTNTVTSNEITDQVKVYKVPPTAIVAGGSGISMSSIEVSSASSSSPIGIRRHRAPGTGNKVMMPITELSANVFDDVDKSKVVYIDLAETKIKDFTVNRDGGVMDGFGDNALIYLPADNSDGGEPNVVVDGQCTLMKLYDTHKFLSPRTFKAATADVNRSFTPNVSETLVLPFSIPANQMQNLGKHYEWKEMGNDHLVFKEYNALADLNAAKPYVFVPNTDKMVVNNVDVVEISEAATASSGLIGTFSPLQWAEAPADIYVYQPVDTEGNENVLGSFVKAQAGDKVSTFHAYLKVGGSEQAEYQNYVDGLVPTDINVIYDLHIYDLRFEDAVYDLQGRRVNKFQFSNSQMKRGLYIQQGRKVIVK